MPILKPAKPAILPVADWPTLLDRVRFLLLIRQPALRGLDGCQLAAGGLYSRWDEVCRPHAAYERLQPGECGTSRLIGPDRLGGTRFFGRSSRTAKAPCRAPLPRFACLF